MEVFVLLCMNVMLLLILMQLRDIHDTLKNQKS